MNFSNLPVFSFERILPNETVATDADTETRLICDESRSQGIQAIPVPNTQILKLQYGKHNELIRMHKPSLNRGPAERICQSKNLTRAFLQFANIPVPNGYAIFENDSDELIVSMFDKLSKPIVVKPANGTRGDGVSVNVIDSAEALKLVRSVFEKYEPKSAFGVGCVIMEEMVGGSEYRILATPTEILAVMYREPANIVGDGIHSISDLVTIKNKEPIRNLSEDLYPHIVIDDAVIDFLSNQGLNADSIPNLDEKIYLRQISNIMMGGDAHDITDDIHPSVRQLITSAVASIEGLTFCGVDFITSDIYADQKDVKCAIIEINSAPEFAMHDFPMFGKSRNITRHLVEMMFPEAYQK
ncbi:hypothetical protein KBD81_04280 [Candidatus Woesebacteria bacterium]|nr:hypothetical protein [Candidatus Woesebacteria bacterium]